MSSDTLTRACDEYLAEGRHDDAIRARLYFLLGVKGAPIVTAEDHAIAMMEMKDAIESHAETLAEQDAAEKRDPEEREEIDAHEEFPGCA